MKKGKGEKKGQQMKSREHENGIRTEEDGKKGGEIGRQMKWRKGESGGSRFRDMVVRLVIRRILSSHVLLIKSDCAIQ